MSSKENNSSLEKRIEAAKAYKKNVKLYNRISSAVISGVIALTAVMLAVLPRPEVSELEKRELTPMPEFSAEALFSGEYFSGIAEHFSDTVPFREQLVVLNSRMKKAMGISAPTFYGTVDIVADDEGNSLEDEPVQITPQQTEPVMQQTDAADDSPDEAASEPAVSETTTASETTGIADFSNNGIVVDGVKMYGEDAGVMLFGGNKKQGARYAEIINKFKASLENVNVYNMVVPTSVEFYLPKKYSKYSSSEKDSIDYIYSCLSPDVIPIDAYSKIAEHTDEYIYLRTDHHWAPLGAYYAYTAFCEALGMEYHPITDYTEKVKQGFVGSLYGYTNDITLANAPEEFHYFLPPDVTYSVQTYNYATLAPKKGGALFHEYVEGANCYGMFLGADAIHTKITTSTQNGRKIVVFKESYGNAFVPFLVNNFEQIYVIDIRYFGTNAVDYIKKIGATDVLFIDNCFAANTSSLIKHIEDLYSSPTGSVVTTVTESETTVSEEQTSETKKKKKKKNTEQTVKEENAETTKKTAETTAPPKKEQESVTVTATAKKKSNS
ncbi:MAG: DHHW family protein [Oscillospiraceae bacterium]